MRSTSICKFVLLFDGLKSTRPIFPISVLDPVAVTIALPCPFTTKVPEITRCPICFSTANDSPVIADSSIIKLVTSSNSASAGTRSPSLSRITSSKTIFWLLIFSAIPLRMTVAFGADNVFSAAKALSVFWV